MAVCGWIGAAKKSIVLATFDLRAKMKAEQDLLAAIGIKLPKRGVEIKTVDCWYLTNAALFLGMDSKDLSQRALLAARGANVKSRWCLQSGGLQQALFKPEIITVCHINM